MMLGVLDDLVRLPSEDILYKRFNENGFSNFAQHTGIFKKVSGKPTLANVVRSQLQQAVNTYIEYLEETEKDEEKLKCKLDQLHKNKLTMLSLLLREYPQYHHSV